MGPKSFPGIFQAIAQGYCRGVEMITLIPSSMLEVDGKCLNTLAEALQVDGALPALKTFDIILPNTPSFLLKLARALMGGAVPLLEHWNLRQRSVTGEDMNTLADMLEARAGIPNCQRLQTFDANFGSWLDNASPDTQIRLLRALLPSLKELGKFQWNAAFDPCFRDVRPHLEILRVRPANDWTSRST